MNPVVHFEMPATDRKRVAKFYEGVFGWQMQLLGEEMGNYVLTTTTETDEKQMVKKPGAINGGYPAAFLVGAIFAALAAGLGVALLRPTLAAKAPH